MMRTFLLTSGGLGFLRPAPGTWGSLPPAGAAWLMLLAGAPEWAVGVALLALLLVSSGACIVFGVWAEERFGRKDPSEVVADETAGMCPALLPLLLFPEALGGDFWRISLATGAAFVIFRLADILKPPPADALQKLPAGWGILVDDLFAGVYAAIPVGVGLALLSAPS